MGRRGVVAICVAALLAVPVTLALVTPSRDLFASRGLDRPSEVAGEPVPAILRDPDVRMAVAGDTGTGEASQHATAHRMAIEGRSHPFDALLLLGDLIYEDGDAALTDGRVVEPFAAVTETGTELLPVLGNHDYESGEQQQILTALGRTGGWYAERVGPVRVVVLDSNRVDDAEQTRWLRSLLAQPEPADTWTVVAMHHPAYSAGWHGSDLSVRRSWGPLFAEFGVALVLAGHDHDYQRSHPQRGVTYVVSGAGAKLRSTGHEDFTAVSSATLHFLDLLFYDDRLVGRAIDQSGRLIDTFTIHR